MDDGALVGAMRQSDPLAIAEFVERYRPLLLSEARRWKASEAESEDRVMNLLHDMAIQLSVEQRPAPRSLPRYLINALRNRAQNAHRAATRRWRHDQEAAVDVDAAGLDGEPVVLAASSEGSVLASRGAYWDHLPIAPALE